MLFVLHFYVMLVVVSSLCKTCYNGETRQDEKYDKRDDVDVSGGNHDVSCACLGISTQRPAFETRDLYTLKIGRAHV